MSNSGMYLRPCPDLLKGTGIAWNQPATHPTNNYRKFNIAKFPSYLQSSNTIDSVRSRIADIIHPVIITLE